jgi:hypothetical protein
MKMFRIVTSFVYGGGLALIIGIGHIGNAAGLEIGFGDKSVKVVIDRMAKGSSLVEVEETEEQMIKRYRQEEEEERRMLREESERHIFGGRALQMDD